MRISDWSSDVCSSDLEQHLGVVAGALQLGLGLAVDAVQREDQVVAGPGTGHVEQADALVVAHLLVDGDVVLELLGDDLLAHPVADPPPTVAGEVDLHRAASATGAGRHAAHDGDGEIEPPGGWEIGRASRGERGCPYGEISGGG